MSSTGTAARAANEVVNVWLTTTDQANLLAPQTSINFAADAGTIQSSYGYGQ